MFLIALPTIKPFYEPLIIRVFWHLGDDSFIVMITDVKHKSPEELYMTPIVQQTTFWHDVKKLMGVNSLAINYKARVAKPLQPQDNPISVATDVLVVIQNIDRYSCIAYVPYGPEVEPLEGDQGPFLEELSECLRPYLPKGCIAIRYDLFWESFWAKDEDNFDDNGWWLGPPEVAMQELRFNFNTISWNLKKAYSNILPSNTLFLDLKLGTDELLAQMKSKTRYNIKLSQRKGVVVRALGMDQIDLWYNVYSQTAQRNNIYLHSIDHFASMLRAEVTNTLSPAEVMLLVAEVDNLALAAMFLVISGNRGSYLYGASTSENRNYMATYAIQWEAMRIAKSRGCTEYDMFGIAPNPDSAHPLHGLYRFKTGFGGHQYHTLGCWDYPLDEEKYRYFTTMEMSSQGYHLQ